MAAADRESALGEVRMRSELARSAYQLRLFAEVLADGGYLEITIDHPDPERRIELRHSEGFRRRSDGALIDLHWNALMQPFRDDDLWSAAIDVEIGGVPTRAPCATDQLLLVIAHSLLHEEFGGSLLGEICPHGPRCRFQRRQCPCLFLRSRGIL